MKKILVFIILYCFFSLDINAADRTSTGYKASLESLTEGLFTDSVQPSIRELNEEKDSIDSWAIEKGYVKFLKEDGIEKAYLCADQDGYVYTLFSAQDLDDIDTVSSQYFKDVCKQGEQSRGYLVENSLEEKKIFNFATNELLEFDGGFGSDSEKIFVLQHGIPVPESKMESACIKGALGIGLLHKPDLQVKIDRFPYDSDCYVLLITARPHSPFECAIVGNDFVIRHKATQDIYTVQEDDERPWLYKLSSTDASKHYVCSSTAVEGIRMINNKRMVCPIIVKIDPNDDLIKKGWIFFDEGQKEFYALSDMRGISIKCKDGRKYCCYRGEKFLINQDLEFLSPSLKNYINCLIHYNRTLAIVGSSALVASIAAFGVYIYNRNKPEPQRLSIQKSAAISAISAATAMGLYILMTQNPVELIRDKSGESVWIPY